MKQDSIISPNAAAVRSAEIRLEKARLAPDRIRSEQFRLRGHRQIDYPR